MNPYLPREAEVVGRTQESPNTFTLELRLTDGEPYDFSPGQFNMLYLYGSGEVPISIVADAEDTGILSHTIRALGRITNGLAALKVGDRIGLDTTICILEAMKLMNELEAEVSGTIREICVDNAEPVEFGQVLFRIDPT